MERPLCEVKIYGFMPSIGSEGIMFSGRPSVGRSVRPCVVLLLTPITRDAIFPYLVEGF